MFEIKKRIFVSIFLCSMVSFSFALPPASISENTRVELDGTLEVFIRENLETGASQHEFFLNRGPDAAPIELLFINGPPSEMRSGIGISVRGLVRNGNIEVEATNVEASSSETQTSTSEESASAAEAASLDTRTAVVIMVNASDVVHRSADITNMSNYYFGDQNSMKDMYDKISFGQLVIDEDVDNADGNGSAEPDGISDVFGPITSTLTAAEICANPFAHVNEFLNAAEALGVDPALYKHRIFAVPRDLGCGWTGYANVGCGGTCSAFNRWSQDRNTTSHEMAHNLGMGHAGKDGGAEYSDYSSFMGYSLSSGVRALDAAHHWQMGWYESFDPASTEVVSVSGTYDIASLQETQLDSDGPSLLAPSIIRINVSNGDPYFLSARQAEGYDADLTNLNSAALSGVNIHRHPSSGYGISWRVAQLDAGQSYTDTINNLTITQNGVKSIDEVVSLNIDLGDGECIEADPSLSLNPTFATVGPDTDYEYSVALTNNDSLICGASTFDLIVNEEASSFATLGVAPGDQASSSLLIAGSNVSMDIDFTVNITQAPGVTAIGTLSVDATPPQEVTDLTGSHTKKGKNHRVGLNWTDSNSNDVSSYEIYRDESFITSTSQNSYTDTLGRTVVDSYNYRVKTVDNVGNISSGASIEVSTAGGDTGGGGNGNGNGGGKPTRN